MNKKMIALAVGRVTARASLCAGRRQPRLTLYGRLDETIMSNKYSLTAQIRLPS